MNKQIYLKKFQASELIFDEVETKLILKFIFKSKYHMIESMVVNDRVREFAQGLLLEAIDASFAFGFIESLMGSVINPGINIKNVFSKFAKKAVKHWFNHATTSNLMDIKIYEAVRRDIDWAFGRILIMYVNGTAMNIEIHTGLIAYKLDDNESAPWG